MTDSALKQHGAVVCQATPPHKDYHGKSNNLASISTNEPLFISQRLSRDTYLMTMYVVGV